MTPHHNKVQQKDFLRFSPNLIFITRRPVTYLNLEIPVCLFFPSHKKRIYLYDSIYLGWKFTELPIHHSFLEILQHFPFTPFIRSCFFFFFSISMTKM